MNTVFSLRSSNVGSALLLIRERSWRGTRTSNLTVLRADLDHGGEYLCVGSNTAGAVTARLQLTLAAKPMTTTTLDQRARQGSRTRGELASWAVQSKKKNPIKVEKKIGISLGFFKR